MASDLIYHKKNCLDGFNQEDLRGICKKIKKNGNEYFCKSGIYCIDKEGDYCGRVSRQLREIQSGKSDLIFFFC